MDENIDAAEIENEANIQEEAGWTPVREQQSADLTKWQLSPEPLLNLCEHELRGEAWDESSRTWELVGEAIMNEKGIRAVISTLRFYVNKIVFLSDLENEYIFEMMRTLADDLTQLLFNNGEQFEIDWSKSYQNNVVNNITSLVFSATRKAYMEGERKFLQTSTRELRRVDEGYGQQKEGRFNLFKK